MACLHTFILEGSVLPLFSEGDAYYVSNHYDVISTALLCEVRFGDEVPIHFTQSHMCSTQEQVILHKMRLIWVYHHFDIPGGANICSYYISLRGCIC